MGAVGAEDVIRRSEGKSSWRINDNKSTPPVQRESWQLYFTIFNNGQDLAS